MPSTQWLAPCSPQAQTELLHFLKLARPEWSVPRRHGHSDTQRVVKKLRAIGITDAETLVRRIEKNELNGDLERAGFVGLSKEAIDSIRKQRPFLNALESVESPHIRQLGHFSPAAQMLSTKRLTSMRIASPTVGGNGKASSQGFGQKGDFEGRSIRGQGATDDACSDTEIMSDRRCSRQQRLRPRLDSEESRSSSPERSVDRQGREELPSFSRPRLRGVELNSSRSRPGQLSSSMHSWRGSPSDSSVATPDQTVLSRTMTAPASILSPTRSGKPGGVSWSQETPGSSSGAALAETDAVFGSGPPPGSRSRAIEYGGLGPPAWSASRRKTAAIHGEDMLQEQRALEERDRLVRSVKVRAEIMPFRKHIATNIKYRLLEEARRDPEGATSKVAIQGSITNIRRQLIGLADARRELANYRSRLQVSEDPMKAMALKFEGLNQMKHVHSTAEGEG